MATKKTPAKKPTVDRFDENWDGAKIAVRDRNGKPIAPDSAIRKTGAKSKKK